jgi:hypothetical protein
VHLAGNLVGSLEPGYGLAYVLVCHLDLRIVLVFVDDR